MQDNPSISDMPYINVAQLMDSHHQLHNLANTSSDHAMAISISTDARHYDPLVPNPVVSHLQQLLEDDDHACTELSMSFDELAAYRAKASELAAILNEDSPDLSFNSTFAIQHAASSSVLAEGPMPAVPSCQGPLRPSSIANSLDVLQTSQNSPFRNSTLQTLSTNIPSHMSSKVFNVQLFNNLAILKPDLVTASKEVDNFNAYHESAATTLYKPHRTVEALMLCRESVAAPSIGNSGAPPLHVDLNDLLLECARAIGSNNTASAMAILRIVKQHASPYRSGLERLAFYFAEALDARFSGTGWQIYSGDILPQHPPSLKQVLKASGLYMLSCPFGKAIHCFVNQTILDAAQGASTLHIVEFNCTGFQYPSLFKALAARSGGPPQVRLIAPNSSDFANSYGNFEAMWEALKRTGQKISACAASYGVPFHFIPWAGELATFRSHDFVSPKRNLDEVLVLLSMHPLRFIDDDALHSFMRKTSSSMRTMELAANPDLAIQVIVTGSYSTPFFLRRFKEALLHFASQYDMLDTFIDRENVDRVVFESEILGKAVLNIVACEMSDVIERVYDYKKVQMITKEAGFKQLPMKEGIKKEVQNILKSWHKDLIVVEDVGYILMGWRGRMLHALSLWTGSCMVLESV